MAVNNALIIKNFLSIVGVIGTAATGSAYVLGDRGNHFTDENDTQYTIQQFHEKILNPRKEKTQKAQEAVRLLRTVHV